VRLGADEFRGAAPSRGSRRSNGRRIAMRKVIVTEFLSLDGVMQAPGDPDEDRSGGFPHGGWQMRYFDDVFAEMAFESMKETGGFLFGRRTYEIMAAFWPSQPDDDPFAATLNGLPKYVASTTLSEPLEWRNSTLLQGDVAKAVAELKQQPGGNLVVLGSGELVQTLMENDLVDQFALSINPIVVGSGKRLFRDGSPKRPLKLVESTTSSTGVLIATYEPERS
jgi:dihydrofolate reductase